MLVAGARGESGVMEGSIGKLAASLQIGVGVNLSKAVTLAEVPVDKEIG